MTCRLDAPVVLAVVAANVAGRIDGRRPSVTVMSICAPLRWMVRMSLSPALYMVGDIAHVIKAGDRRATRRHDHVTDLNTGGQGGAVGQNFHDHQAAAIDQLDAHADVTGVSDIHCSSHRRGGAGAGTGCHRRHFRRGHRGCFRRGHRCRGAGREGHAVAAIVAADPEAVAACDAAIDASEVAWASGPAWIPL